MTFSPRAIIASSTRACPSSPPVIRRSTVESPPALTSSTPGRAEGLEVLRRRGVEERGLNRRGVRAPGEFPHGPANQELPMVQERDVVAHLLDLAEEMRAHEDRAALVFQRLDHIADLGHAARIQPGRGLVEDEQVRLVEERLGDRQALLHPFRKLLDPMVRPFCQLDLFEDGFAAIAEILRRHPAEPARVGEGLQGRQVAVELRGLDDRTDSSERTRRFPPDIDTEEGGPTAGRRNQVRHDLDGRRLAGSIRAEEAERGAFRDRQVEGLEGGEVTVFLSEAFKVHGGIAGDWLLNDGFHGIAIYRDILKTW